MNNIVIFFLSLLTIQLMYQIVKMRLEIKSLKADKELAEELANRRLLKYKMTFDRLIKEAQSKSVKIPKGTIEAVRYAMIHNHPDNSGSAEKFILYKKCYDELIKQKNNKKGE